ncbi:hypothetical protein ACFE04_014527 [Oxalis oulophora]
MAMSQARVLSNQLKRQPAFILRPYETCSIESMTYLMLRYFSSGKEGFRNRGTYNDNVDTRRQREGENRNQNFQESDPNVNPRRETRSRRPSRSNCDSPPSFNSNRSSPPADPDVRRRNNDAPPLSDYAFLDKFKIAANKKETEPNGSRTAETELPVNDHQPINNKTDVQSPPQNADEIFRKMKETGLVDGICKEKGVEEAHIVVARLKQKGFFPNEKSLREFLEKRAPFSPSVWEAIFGKKTPQGQF